MKLVTINFDETSTPDSHTVSAITGANMLSSLVFVQKHGEPLRYVQPGESAKPYTERTLEDTSIMVICDNSDGDFTAEEKTD